MTGVVLCGGQSSRMGSDKGLLLQDSEHWAHLIGDIISGLNIPVVLSVNEQQLTAYKRVIEDFALVPDKDNLEIGGPLRGLLSVHLQTPGEDLLVIACDMPSIQPEVLAALRAAYHSSDYEIYVFQDGAQVEPLCGIYTSSALSKVHKQYVSGQLLRHSMHSFIGSSNTCYLPLAAHFRSSFKNYNSPNDLKSL
jgi:molybdopterin-guanine dinucleotide biosynthesis protein A